MVAKATLKVYVGTVTTAGSFNIDLVTSTWSESTITASDSPTLGSALASAIPVTKTDKNQYLLVDVTTAAVDWLNGTPNDGLAIVPDGTVAFTLNSKRRPPPVIRQSWISFSPGLPDLPDRSRG